jgi:hypothetical protein
MANAKPENGKQAANPKQVLILAALFAVMITVGVVQFSGLLGGGVPLRAEPIGTIQQQYAGGDASNRAGGHESANAAAAFPARPVPPRDCRPEARAGAEPSRAERADQPPKARNHRHTAACADDTAPRTVRLATRRKRARATAAQLHDYRRCARTEFRRDFSGQRGAPTLRQARRPAGRRLARGQHPARRDCAAERQTAHHCARRRIDRPERRQHTMRMRNPLCALVAWSIARATRPNDCAGRAGGQRLAGAGTDPPHHHGRTATAPQCKRVATPISGTGVQRAL